MKEFLAKYSWVIITALLGILIVVGIIRKPSPVVVERIGEWKEAPTIIICPSSPYTLEEVNEVVQRYEARGHHFEEVIEFSSCPDGNISGWIMLKPAGQNIEIDEAGHATTRYDSATGEIISSSIEIFNAQNIYVLEHELGHALGYQHVNRRGHIMYPNVSGLGPDDEGMFRIETISE